MRVTLGGEPEFIMHKERVQEAIALLEREVPRDGAHVRLRQYGGGPDEGQVIANETGFLRLGIEFMKGAFLPVDSGQGAAVKVDVTYLITPDSDINFDWFERREPSDDSSAAPRSRVVSALLLSALLAVALLAILGLVTVVRWLAA